MVGDNHPNYEKPTTVERGESKKRDFAGLSSASSFPESSSLPLLFAMLSSLDALAQVSGSSAVGRRPEGEQDESRLCIKSCYSSSTSTRDSAQCPTLDFALSVEMYIVTVLHNGSKISGV